MSFLEEVTSSWDCREGERKKLEIEAGVWGSGGAIINRNSHTIGTQRAELFVLWFIPDRHPTSFLLPFDSVPPL